MTQQACTSADIAQIGRQFQDYKAGGGDPHVMPDHVLQLPSNPKLKQASELLDRPMPSDYDAELATVGGLLFNPQLFSGSGLYDLHFHHDGPQAAFRIVRQMVVDGEPIDLPHFVQALKSAELYDGIGGKLFVAELLRHGEVASPLRFPGYVERLKDRENRRRALLAAVTIIKSVHSSGEQTQDILDAAAAQFEIFSDAARPALEYETLTLAELVDSETETVYYAENLLAAGEPCIMGAPPKSMKTSNVTDLAVSLATGTPVWGVHDVPEPVRVCVMSGESGKAASKICYRSVLESKGLTASDVDGLLWSPAVPRIGTPEHRVAMRNHLQKFRPQVLIVDPAYRALECESPDNLFRQGALLGELDDLCRSAGATLILVHHTKRMPGREFAPTTLDDLAWAGFREFFRQWILISRRKPYEIGSGIHELRIDSGGSARHSWSGAVTIDEGPFESPRWYVTVQGVSEVHESEQAARERQREQAKASTREANHRKLVQAAIKHKSGETMSQLCDAAGLSRAAGRAALSDAIEAGDLVGCEVAKNGRLENGYKVKK